MKKSNGPWRRREVIREFERAPAIEILYYFSGNPAVAGVRL
jgi:hypothetical protein